MTPAERFAANLRTLRRASGHSQEALSFLADMNGMQVGQYERGTVIPRALGLVKLAGALRVTPDDLLAGIEWMPEDGHSPGRLLVREEDA